MAREGLSSARSEAFHHAVRTNTSFTAKGVKVGTNGGSKLVVFTDVVAPPAKSRPGKAERATLQGNQLAAVDKELQHVREELQTVNHELQAKLDELTLASDDMKNLLNSTDIATLFLDGDLRVRRFTTRTATLIKLIPGDAGRAITDIVSELDYPELAADAREVLRTLVYRERQVRASGGRWFSARIMPYRTQNNHIDGVVITFWRHHPA